MKLFELIERSTHSALKLQHMDGSMPAGHNGSYNDPETPVRNTAHWLITLLKIYNLTGEIPYLKAAENAVNYLMSPAARPMSGSWWCRKNPEKDFSNGLIGQAWVIEALVKASVTLERSDLLDEAVNLFNLHPFDLKEVGWRSVNVDGCYGSLDYTFNHQLWFAAVGAEISQVNNNINPSITEFMDKLSHHIVTYKSGLIKHTSPHFLTSNKIKRTQKILNAAYESKNRQQAMFKASGYHGFNLYAMALLYKVFPQHSFWQTPTFNSVIIFSQQPNLKKELRDNYFSYSYNPSGFEIPFALETFTKDTDLECQSWLQAQIELTLNTSSLLFNQGTNDPNTLMARIYEATRLKNYTVDIKL